MVWIAKWIKENMPESRILIITDRTELDEQIEKVFKGMDEDLIEKLNKSTPQLIGSLVHKFGKKGEDASEKDYDEYIDDMKKSLRKDFRAKGDI